MSAKKPRQCKTKVRGWLCDQPGGHEGRHEVYLFGGILIKEARRPRVGIVHRPGRKHEPHTQGTPKPA